MKQRTDTSLYIKRGNTTLYTLPITAKSARRFTLMQEDCIVVCFSMASAPKFEIGDYIDDELFGRFYVTEEQMPKYNAATGGYDYELRLDAEYRAWNNWLLCLVADGKRMESQWTLTDRLLTHAQQVIANLTALGITGWSVDASAVSNAAEIHCITYSAKHILDAMTAMADEWGCEWWVDVAAKKIHFGKCESGDTALDFTLGDNAESMDIANNRNTYATRIYAYGGMQNIPETYDRSLVFTNTEASSPYGDANRPLTLAMLQGLSVTDVHFGDAVLTANTGELWSRSFGVGGGGGVLNGNLKVVATTNLSSQTFTISIQLLKTGTIVETLATATTTAPSGVYQASLTLATPLADYNLTGGSYNIKVSVSLANASAEVSGIYVESYITLTQQVQSALEHRTLRTLDGAEYAITFGENNDADAPLFFTFDSSAPSGWSVGTQYTIDGLTFDIPASYYTPDYDGGVLSKVGEKRLHLPLADYPNRCVPASAITSPMREVELAVVWEDVYPRLALKVASVETAVLYDTIEHDDGSTTKESWVQYKITATKADNTAFDFEDKYMLNGKLQAHFTTPTSITADGYRLAGMTFDVGFAKVDGARVYTLVRNEDYGITLPNSELRPSVGDTFFLTGWNPLAMTSLGLVADAEAELAAKATAYMEAIEEGQFTFTCKMMSGWPFALESDIPLYTSDDEPVKEAGGSWFYVSNGYDYYRLPKEGAKVAIHHGALGGTKISRVIGYVLKLDMPWDSPTYTVGETQAYSRLAQMEKEIQKLS